MTGWSILWFGIGLGVRHATDPDHVVVIAALVDRERSALRAARIAALWGLGHTATFLGLGLAIVLAGAKLPGALEVAAEALVGVMLVALGAWHLLRLRRVEPAGSPPTAGTLRPLVFGLVHGLAGSAGAALLASTTVPSPGLAATYLALVALGTMLGMIGLTVALAGVGRALQRRRRGRLVALVGALLSLALGTWMLGQLGVDALVG
jgi:nickel/cobalt exporter